MNKCVHKIKQYIQILVFLLNLITFIIISIIYNKNQSYYEEYTTLSKYVTNAFIIIIFLILLLHSIYPKMICSFISDNLNFFLTDRGKIVVNISIGIMYWSCDDIPLLVFTIINFVSSFALFLSEFVFQCNILEYGSENAPLNEKNINEINNDIQK